MGRGRFVALLLTACLTAAERSALADPVPEHELFVGNSLTYYNDLPAMVRAIEAGIEPTHHVETDMLVSGGATLAERLEDGGLQRVLAAKRYGWVVLQDRGGYPICADHDSVCANFARTLGRAVTLIRQAGAEPLLYSTYQPDADVQAEMSRKVVAIAEPLALRVADVGAAFQRAERTRLGLGLLLADGHPAATGSWLAAMTVVRAQRAASLGPLRLPSICRRVWQSAYLTAVRLVSEQAPAATDCSLPTEADIEVLRTVANGSTAPPAP